MRQFETGATRDTEVGKLDFEGFLSPLVLEAYAEYLNKHRVQVDGNIRESDNWQKGIPFTVYIKSAFRHFFDWWKLHRGYKTFDRKTKEPITIQDAVCGVLFNAMGYIHEYEKAQETKATT